MGLITVLALNQYLKNPAAASTPPRPKGRRGGRRYHNTAAQRNNIGDATIASVPEVPCIRSPASIDEAVGGISRADIVRESRS